MPTHRSASADARRVAFASAVGTTVEWYDFFIYGTAAATVFGPQFFPQVSEVAGTLAAFATFGIGFIARPLGGVVMGHYGDRIGRKGMLVWALLLMGGATMGIGLLPTYATIGAWAPVLLVTLRFVQGFALGGEWSGAVLMSVFHQLSAGKSGRGPGSAAFAAGTVAGHCCASAAGGAAAMPTHSRTPGRSVAIRLIESPFKFGVDGAASLIQGPITRDARLPRWRPSRRR